MSLCALVISIFSKGVALGTQSKSARRIRVAVEPRIIYDYMFNYIQNQGKQSICQHMTQVLPLEAQQTGSDTLKRLLKTFDICRILSK